MSVSTVGSDRYMLFVVVVLLLMATLGTGCGRGQHAAQPARRPERWVIAVVPEQTEGRYWRRVEQGARKAAKTLGVELEWRGPMTRKETEAQAVILRDLIQARVDGIGLAPIDRRLLASIIAQEAVGTPIVLFHSPFGSLNTTRPESTAGRFSPLDPSVGGSQNMRARSAFPTRRGFQPICRIVADPRESGLAAAQKTLELLGGIRARLLVIHSKGDMSDSAMRVQAFAQWMTDASMDVLADVACAETAPVRIQAELRNKLNGFVRDNQLQLDGIFAADQQVAAGLAAALRELRDAHVTSKLVVTAYADVPALDRFVQDGLVTIVLGPDPNSMGKLVVESLVRHLRGETVSTRVDPGTTVIAKQ